METDLRLITTLYSYALLFSVIRLISMWRIYKKAGQPGWAAIVPFYNIIIWLKIISKPAWWLILLFIPLINVVVLIWMINLLAKKFDRNIGFTFGLIFLGMIFFPLLAFKEYNYKGNNELPSDLNKDSEVRQDKLLIWALIIIFFNALFWFAFSNFMKEWGDYFYIYTPVSVLSLFSYFLIGISVSNKRKTLSIVLSIIALIIYFVNALLPSIKEFIQNN